MIGEQQSGRVADAETKIAELEVAIPIFNPMIKKARRRAGPSPDMDRNKTMRSAMSFFCV